MTLNYILNINIIKLFLTFLTLCLSFKINKPFLKNYLNYKIKLLQQNQPYLLSSLSSSLSPSSSSSSSSSSLFTSSLSSSLKLFDNKNYYKNKQLYPSIIEKSRTIPNVCVSGTLCTTSNSLNIEGSPFGSSIDYITDEKGWPIILLNEASEYANNIKVNPRVSLFCQLPSAQYYGEVPSTLGRVTIVGDIVPVKKREESTYKYAFPLVHPHTQPFLNSPKYSFRKIRPIKIHYTGGYGVLSDWVNVTEYENSVPDNLALEIPRLLPRINLEKQTELKLVCKHFLQLEKIESVKVHTIDRLGLDLRVQLASNSFPQQYRIAFRHSVHTIEDAKSELLKLFQECWEREHTGKYYTTLPETLQYTKEFLEP